MSDKTSLFVSTVIFDRTKNGQSDVPVFSAALKSKLNNSEFDIHSRSIPVKNVFPTKSLESKGDPSRGQTLGFPFSPKESSSPKKSINNNLQEKFRSNFDLKEDPQLLPVFDSSELLIEWLKHNPHTKTEEKLKNSSSLELSPMEKRAIFFYDQLAQKKQEKKTEIIQRKVEKTYQTARRSTINSSPIKIKRAINGVIKGWERKLLRYSSYIKKLSARIFDRLYRSLQKSRLILGLGYKKVLLGLNNARSSLIKIPNLGYKKLTSGLSKLHRFADKKKTAARYVQKNTKEDITRYFDILKKYLIQVYRFSKDVQKKFTAIPIIISVGTYSVIVRCTTKIVDLESYFFGKFKPLVASIKTLFVPKRFKIKVIRPKLGKVNTLRIASRTLIIGSLVLVLFTFLPIVVLQGQEWVKNFQTSLRGHADVVAFKENLRVDTKPLDFVPPVDEQFQLQIPKIGANMKVIANVDAGDEKAYDEALKHGVAHVKGTNLPGENSSITRTIYIFGHSTNAPWNIAKYNALFYSIKDLKPGDEIIVWFWGKQYHYVMREQKIIAPDDVSYLQPQMKKDQLILQTCWPPGTTWRRLLVIADPLV